jgi:hypothetical protein
MPMRIDGETPKQRAAKQEMEKAQVEALRINRKLDKARQRPDIKFVRRNITYVHHVNSGRDYVRIVFTEVDQRNNEVAFREIEIPDSAIYQLVKGYERAAA